MAVRPVVTQGVYERPKPLSQVKSVLSLPLRGDTIGCQSCRYLSKALRLAVRQIATSQRRYDWLSVLSLPLKSATIGCPSCRYLSKALRLAVRHISTCQRRYDRLTVLSLPVKSATIGGPSCRYHSITKLHSNIFKVNGFEEKDGSDPSREAIQTKLPPSYITSPSLCPHN